MDAVIPPGPHPVNFGTTLASLSLYEKWVFAPLAELAYLIAAYYMAFLLKSRLLLPDFFFFKSTVYNLWSAFFDYKDCLEIVRWVERF